MRERLEPSGIFSGISRAIEAFNREATVTLSLRILIRIGVLKPAYYLAIDFNMKEGAWPS